MRSDGSPGFPTPSGKFEIASTLLRRYGYEPLPVFVPPRESPATDSVVVKRFPLVFNSGSRNRVFFNSQHHNIPSLARARPQPLVWIHPQDASPRQIADGDAVDIVTPRGRVRFRAHPTEDIMPGCVEADAHGGNPSAPEPWRQCNVNELTDSENRDPVSGFPVYKALLCDVVKAGP